MKSGWRAGVPAAVFVAASLWGILAMQPYAPKPHEWMMWIPATVTASSLTMAWVSAAIVDQMPAMSNTRARSRVVFSRWTLIVALLVALAVFIACVTSSGLDRLLTFFVGASLVLYASVASLVAAARHRAKFAPTIFIMLLQSAALVLTAFLVAHDDPSLDRVSESWFTASILASGLSALAVARYWQALLNDPLVSFSPMIRSVLRFFAGDMALSTWQGRNLVKGDPVEVTAKGPVRRRQKRGRESRRRR